MFLFVMLNLFPSSCGVVYDCFVILYMENVLPNSVK